MASAREVSAKSSITVSPRGPRRGEAKLWLTLARAVDNEPFKGEWGRPQNDGPALRVITLVEYAHYQLDHGSEKDKEFVKSVLYDSNFPTESVIKGDLEHIAHRWAEPGYDREFEAARAWGRKSLADPL